MKENDSGSIKAIKHYNYTTQCLNNLTVPILTCAYIGGKLEHQNRSQNTFVV